MPHNKNKVKQSRQCPPVCKKFVAYYRVSTKKQGLGIDAQKFSVNSFVAVRHGKLVGEFEERESGKFNSRVEMDKAIALAKKENATLLVAKLDRLSRDVEFIFRLKNSGVDFICADNPEANTLTIGVMASMAQHERELISQRTKAALAALKAKGVKLGSPKPISEKAIKAGNEANRKRAREQQANKQAYMFIEDYRKANMTWREIADKLNSKGLQTVNGKSFQATTAMRIYNMFAEVVA